MIRLVASDIDGTLLQHGATRISDRLFEQVHELKKHGIVFAVASGRQYHSLRTLFEPVKDDILYICENGGAIYQNDECVYEDVMQTDLLLGILRDSMALDGCEVLINGARNAYTIPKQDDFARLLREDYHMIVQEVDSLEHVPEMVVKMAVYHPDGAKILYDYFRPRWGNLVKVAISGDCFMDMTSCDKGSGIRAACRMLKFEPSEVMAFGDNYNDVDMLNTVGHPFIMSGAVLDLRQRFPNADTVEGQLDKLLTELG